MTSQAIQDYVYPFKQGRKIAAGLTIADINEAANHRGVIQIKEIKYTETTHTWIATAKAMDTLTSNSRYGVYEQLKMGDDGQSPVIREVSNFYLHRKVQTDDAEQ